MALKDIVSRISTEAEKLFHHDLEANRRPMLDRLAKNRAAFTDPSKKVRGGKWFEVGNNSIVAFTPTRPDGQPIVIGGNSVTYWSSEEFPSILDSFEAAIKSGELDDQLEGATPAGASLPARKISTPRKPREGGGSAGWSDERRAKFAATMAARKAAK